MMPLVSVFVQLSALVDDVPASGVVRVPRRPGRAPECSDAKVLAMRLARHLRGHRS